MMQDSQLLLPGCTGGLQARQDRGCVMQQRLLSNLQHAGAFLDQSASRAEHMTL